MHLSLCTIVDPCQSVSYFFAYCRCEPMQGIFFSKIPTPLEIDSKLRTFLLVHFWSPEHPPTTSLVGICNPFCGDPFALAEDLCCHKDGLNFPTRKRQSKCAHCLLLPASYRQATNFKLYTCTCMWLLRSIPGTKNKLLYRETPKTLNLHFCSCCGFPIVQIVDNLRY